MPTFSARLSPKSHFPGPNTGIVFGLFLSAFNFSHLRCSDRKCPKIVRTFISGVFPLYHTIFNNPNPFTRKKSDRHKFFFSAVQVFSGHFFWSGASQMRGFFIRRLKARFNCRLNLIKQLEAAAIFSSFFTGNLFEGFAFHL
jgi:hypothetical protein